MNTQRPLTPLERDRAVARLRRMTVGTALAGIAAVAGLGTVAAITFPGHTGATTAGSATDVAGAVSAVAGTSTSQATTGGSVADSLFSAPTPSPSRSSASAQVVTGGS